MKDAFFASKKAKTARSWQKMSIIMIDKDKIIVYHRINNIKKG